MSNLVQEIFNGILAGDHKLVPAKVSEALTNGIAITTILNDGMIAAMTEVGQRFECGTVFVPEMMIAARAMKEGMAVIKPHLKDSNVKPLGRVIIGTVNRIDQRRRSWQQVERCRVSLNLCHTLCGRTRDNHKLDRQRAIGFVTSSRSNEKVEGRSIVDHNGG